MRKSIAIFLVVILSLVIFVLNDRRKEPDIVGDLNQMRNSDSKHLSELANHHLISDRIDSLVSKGLAVQAIRLIDSVTAPGKNDFTSGYLVRKGQIQFELDQVEESIISFRSALSLSKGHSPKAREWKAFAHVSLNECDSALYEIKIAVSQNSMLKKSQERIELHCESQLCH
ncbi:MAG: hypothetical protein RLN88_04905 [Ekhidna sp.]|uniref:tetratricopeptide repeat protein n=1 Tax=Ekhidna sp. TaxID=2608089 RepID=UPI0032ED0DF4